ncbi:hypothetical protein [Neobacillus terrae]|nr:hypothetical protein [Neobacillus terrae]
MRSSCMHFNMEEAIEALVRTPKTLMMKLIIKLKYHTVTELLFS